MQSSIINKPVGIRFGNQISRNQGRMRATLTQGSVDVFKMSPIGDRILVKPKEAAEKSAGGVLLASSASQSMQDAMVGKVIAVGDEVDLKVAVGDQVLFSKYGTSDVDSPEGKVCFVAEKSVLAILS